MGQIPIAKKHNASSIISKKTTPIVSIAPSVRGSSSKTFYSNKNSGTAKSFRRQWPFSSRRSTLACATSADSPRPNIATATTSSAPPMPIAGSKSNSTMAPGKSSIQRPLARLKSNRVGASGSTIGSIPIEAINSTAGSTPTGLYRSSPYWPPSPLSSSCAVPSKPCNCAFNPRLSSCKSLGIALSTQSLPPRQSPPKTPHPSPRRKNRRGAHHRQSPPKLPPQIAKIDGVQHQASRKNPPRRNRSPYQCV